MYDNHHYWHYIIICINFTLYAVVFISFIVMQNLVFLKTFPSMAVTLTQKHFLIVVNSRNKSRMFVIIIIIIFLVLFQTISKIYSFTCWNTLFFFNAKNLECVCVSKWLISTQISASKREKWSVIIRFLTQHFYIIPWSV